MELSLDELIIIPRLKPRWEACSEMWSYVHRLSSIPFSGASFICEAPSHSMPDGPVVPNPLQSSGSRISVRIQSAMRERHMSPRTEEAYVHWARRFWIFHQRRDLATLGAPEVKTFLNALAIRSRVSASTQNQALSVLLFLYRIVLNKHLPWINDIVRAKTPISLPVVLTREEVSSVLSKIDGVPRLIATLLYGSGLRLLEACRLRVKDVDFSRK